MCRVPFGFNSFNFFPKINKKIHFFPISRFHFFLNVDGNTNGINIKIEKIQKRLKKYEMEKIEKLEKKIRENILYFFLTPSCELTLTHRIKTSAL
jgi:hypothetical protein